jgi:hypothetical protein
VLGHRWPFVPTGNMEEDIKVLSVRARGVMSGLIVFVLINMALGAILAFITPLVPSDPAAAEQLPPETGFIIFLLLVFSFWGFRLTWLYIPYALNIDGMRYLRALGGLMSSISMIGAWLLCFIPFVILVQIIGGLLTPLGDSTAGFIMVLLTVAADTLKNILATAAITYGVMEIFEREKD